MIQVNYHRAPKAASKATRTKVKAVSVPLMTMTIKNISVLFAPQLICYYSRAGTVESLPSSSQQFEAFRSLTRQSLRAFLTFRLKKSLLASDSRGDGGRREEAKKNSSKTIRLFNESKSQSNDERGNVKKSSKVTLLIIIKRSESFDFFSGVFLARLRSREF